MIPDPLSSAVKHSPIMTIDGPHQEQFADVAPFLSGISLSIVSCLHDGCLDWDSEQPNEAC
jgi:hypothetical protein